MAQLTVRQVVKELRVELGLTQEALAAKLGVSSRAVKMWEHGHRVPNGPTLALMLVESPSLTVEVRLVAALAAHGRQERGLKAPEPPRSPVGTSMTFRELEGDLQDRLTRYGAPAASQSLTRSA